MDNKNSQNTSVQDTLDALSDELLQDANTLIEIMQRISESEPKIWDMGSIGFDSYHYKYDSGREGDTFVLGFRPNKAKITIYLMDGTARYAELLAKLGKHTTTGYCLYIKKISDVELTVLEQIIQQSHDFIKSESKDGPINRILWQTEK